MKRGLNSSEIQRVNRCLMLDLMLERRGLTRTELALRSGLQKATITNIINEFLALDLVVEDKDRVSKTGHRNEMLTLKADDMYIVPIAINRKNYKIYVYTLDGVLKEQLVKSLSTDEDIYVTMTRLKDDLKTVTDKIGADNIIDVCLAMPGPYIRRGRDIAFVTGFEQLSRMDVKHELEVFLGRPIRAEHDAKLSAFAEWKSLQENERVNKNASLVALCSTGGGIGAGVIINGRIVEGQLGVAGEIGHIGINLNAKNSDSGYAGALEHFAGTESAVRYMRERLFEFPDSPLTEDSAYFDIVDAYNKGDELARYAIGKMAWTLGYGLSSLVYMLNPDYIIIGKDYPTNPGFIDDIRSAMSRYVYSPILESAVVRSSRMAEDSIMRGGYYFSLHRQIRENSLLERIRDIRARRDGRIAQPSR